MSRYHLLATVVLCVLATQTIADRRPRSLNYGGTEEGGRAGKITICHRAKSDNLWEVISVSPKSLSKHMRHGDAVIDDGIDCTIDTCDPIRGLVHTPVDSDCNDGDVCNGEEVCDPANNGCSPGGTLVCDDNNPCTDDFCDPADGCFSIADDTNSCEDGLFCNGTAHCTNGGCAAVSACPPFIPQCGEQGPCDEENDICTLIPNDADCDDNNPCTDDTCSNGLCDNTQDDSNSCEDGLFCNGSGQCVNGDCAAAEPCPTPPSLECGQQGCNEEGDVCTFIPDDAACDDGNPCTDDMCNGGLCDNIPDDSNSCEDGLFCNGTAYCLNGGCASVSACPPFIPQCGAQGPCDEENDTCTLIPNDADCDDNNPCTDDTCSNGLCENIADDSNSCEGGLCQGGVCAPVATCPCFDAALVSEFAGRCQGQPQFYSIPPDCPNERGASEWNCIGSDLLPSCQGAGSMTPTELNLGAFQSSCTSGTFLCFAFDTIDSDPCIRDISITAPEYEACRNLLLDEFDGN